MTERESMPYDVVIVGAGPAGLAAAIRLKQLADGAGRELSVCILEKGSEVGAHILSGAVVDPRALDELLPDWRELDSPLTVPVTEEPSLGADREEASIALPHLLMPPFMNNKGTYTARLGNLCRWLAGQAEALGVEIFPGFAAAEILFNDDGSVKGVATGDMGVARDGTHKPDYQPGHGAARQLHLLRRGRARASHQGAEAASSISRASASRRSMALGLKELWDIDPDKHVPGRVIHTQGWPLERRPGAAASSTIRRTARSRWASSSRSTTAIPISRRSRNSSAGSSIRRSATILEGGRRVSYGARAINEGGWQAVPQARLPRRRADRLLGGLRQRAADQGQPYRDEDPACSPPRPPLRRSRPSAAGDELAELSSRRSTRSWIATELKMVRNVEPALAKFGGDAGHALGRHRHVDAAR